jgi:K+-sensing histidine kinase KdpD
MSVHPFRSSFRDYLWSTGVAALSTAISIPIQSDLGLANAAMTYLLGVTIISTYCGRGAAILNCILSAVAFYYFCAPPYGSVTLMEYSFITTLFAMLLVSLVITTLTLRARRQSEAARRAELAVEVERTRNALLSAVSHDLKTPLVSIYGAATSILDQEDRLEPAVRRSLIEGIADEAGKLNRLLTNLLEMTRLDAGVEMKKDWQSIEEIAGTALLRLEGVLRNRPVTVSVPPDLPLIQVDEVLMEHVLINILENAAKYTPEGSPIRIVAAGNSTRVKISIYDTGPGFPHGAEEKVFERFYRGSANGTHGAGLGLAICRAIVKAHGGDIAAENRAEGGAAIHIDLPTGGPLPEMDAVAEGPAR